MFFFFVLFFSCSARWLPRTALINAPLGFAAGKDLAAAASLLPRRDDRFVTATWKIQGGVSARRVKRPSPPPPPLIYPHDKWRNRPLRATRSVRFQRLKSSLIGPASERFQLAVAVLTEVGGSSTLNIEQRMTFLNGGYASALFARCLQALLPEGYVGQIQRAEGTFHLPGLLKDALSVISQYRCGTEITILTWSDVCSSSKWQFALVALSAAVKPNWRKIVHSSFIIIISSLVQRRQWWSRVNTNSG